MPMAIKTAGADDAHLPDLLIAGIEDQVGIGLFQAPGGEGGEGGIETLIDAADAGRREAVATELLRSGVDLPGGNALDIHLGDCRYKRLLRTLIALE